jgi:hypothetical protein
MFHTCNNMQTFLEGNVFCGTSVQTACPYRTQHRYVDTYTEPKIATATEVRTQESINVCVCVCVCVCKYVNSLNVEIGL